MIFYVKITIDCNYYWPKLLLTAICIHQYRGHRLFQKLNNFIYLWCLLNEWNFLIELLRWDVWDLLTSVIKKTLQFLCDLQYLIAEIYFIFIFQQVFIILLVFSWLTYTKSLTECHFFINLNIPFIFALNCLFMNEFYFY